MTRRAIPTLLSLACGHLRVAYGEPVEHADSAKSHTTGVCRDCGAGVTREQVWRDERSTEQREADRVALKEYREKDR